MFSVIPCTGPACPVVFFFNDTATTEIYTLSLHDALPIYEGRLRQVGTPEEGYQRPADVHVARFLGTPGMNVDRKSTRLNSSHGYISYAVFCLKKKKHTAILPHGFIDSVPRRDGSLYTLPR